MESALNAFRAELKLLPNLHRGRRLDIRTNPPHRDLECQNQFGVETVQATQSVEKASLFRDKTPNLFCSVRVKLKALSLRKISQLSNCGFNNFNKIIIAVSSNCEAASLERRPRKCDEICDGIKSASACNAELGTSQHWCRRSKSGETWEKLLFYSMARPRWLRMPKSGLRKRKATKYGMCWDVLGCLRTDDDEETED
ncbi:hypothetical protein R3P38DRAFT_2799177 [Favolaschia claudopus]|uniref:Uncharacterized protein n=1 Tax=Favolaschia claudopus TaxID=2862362 RepID=A0AAW0A1L1_9AGAR